MAEIRTEEPAFPVFCQLLAAFAQGAGTLHIAAETITSMVDEYWPAIRRQSDFESTLLEALEFARGLGRIAAHRALDDGSVVVRVEDLHEAARVLPHNPRPLGRCPFCLQTRAT
jgi:hypothetical protein